MFGVVVRITGENKHYGTPINPQVSSCIPGGSSSGSAVAVAAGLVDFALGKLRLTYLLFFLFCWTSLCFPILLFIIIVLRADLLCGCGVGFKFNNEIVNLLSVKCSKHHLSSFNESFASLFPKYTISVYFFLFRNYGDAFVHS